MKNLYIIALAMCLSLFSINLYADVDRENFQKLSQQMQALQKLHTKELSELSARVNENIQAIQKTIETDRVTVSKQISALDRKTQADFKDHLSKLQSQLQSLQKQINDIKSKMK